MAPWLVITFSSLLIPYLLSATQPSWWHLGFTASFFTAWLVQFTAWVVWSVLLYPKIFSPLRHLPEPEGNSFIHGQWRRIRLEPGGRPQREWCDSSFLISTRRMKN
jgi:hypothetical protein